MDPATHYTLRRNTVRIMKILFANHFVSYFSLKCFVDVVNQTAHNLKVKHLEPLPPTKMEDFLNPAAGNFVYATDNAFEQQLYTSQ